MFIKQIQSNFDYVYNGSFIKQGVRKLTYGKLANGTSIGIDNYYKDGKIVEKRYVLWTDTWQKIINKVRKQNDKGFERIG